MEAVRTQLYKLMHELVPSSELSFQIQTSTWRETFHCAYLDLFYKDRPQEIVFERSVARRESSQGLLTELGQQIARDLPNFLNQPRESLPAGKYRVSLPPAHGALLIHEAIGHMLEFRPNGLLNDRTGEQVAPEFVTVIDDPTIANGFGSYDLDDEGERAVKKTLIRNGRIETHLGRPGNLRRENGSYEPAPRMSNTYLESCDFQPEFIRQRAEIGVHRFGAGRVDHRTGRFELVVREAWRLSSEAQQALMPFVIRGHALDLLKNISAVSGPVEFYPSFCRGISGIVPVSYGQPAILIDHLECRPLDQIQPWRISC